jgi:hypothetical protein
MAKGGHMHHEDEAEDRELIHEMASKAKLTWSMRVSIASSIGVTE